MHVPSADELAAIAAAYLAVMPRDDAAPAPAEGSRWRLAGRLPLADARAARIVARGASRWSVAGRLDG